MAESNQDPFPDWFNSLEGEEAVVVTHPHVLIYWKGLVFGTLLIFASIGLLVSGKLGQHVTEMQSYKLALSGVLVGLLLILYEYLHYSTAYYIITTERIYKKTGIIKSQSFDPVFLSDVSDIEFRRVFSQMIFRTGDILIQSEAGTSKFDVIFRDIPQAKTCKEKLEKYRSLKMKEANQVPAKQTHQSSRDEAA